MSPTTHASAQRQEVIDDQFENAILIVDSKEDADAARKHLGRKAYVLDRVTEQLSLGDLKEILLVVSACSAYGRARRLIDSSASPVLVMFVDLGQGQTLRSMAGQESTRDYLNLLLRHPSDPRLHPTVRPLPDWVEHEPTELMACGESGIEDSLLWPFPAITTWVGPYRSASILAEHFAMKAMLTPTGMAQNLQASFCLADDPIDFKARSVRQAQREDLREPDLLRVWNFQRRLWRFDGPSPRPRDLEEWKNDVESMAVYHGVAWHVLDPWVAHIFDPESGEELSSYVSRLMTDLRQFARELGIAIHIVSHTSNGAAQRIDKVKPISVSNTHGSSDFAEFSDYVIHVINSSYLTNLMRDTMRNPADFGDAEIIAARACRPSVDADTHMIMAIDKVKRRGVMRQQEVHAFAYDARRHDVIYDAGATMLVRKIWR